MRHPLALVVCASILAVDAVGTHADAAQNDASTAKKTVFAVMPGASRTSGESGPILVKVSGADTGGAFTVLEVPTAVDSGPPLHLHHVENEWFYALEGEYDIKVR